MGDSNNNLFLSKENKALIWGLLSEKGVFNGINDQFFDRVKSIYEQKILILVAHPESNLKEKNKLLIGEMIKAVAPLKQNTIARPLEEVQIKLEKDLKDKEEEFIKLIKRPTQEEVDFSEKNDKPFEKENMNMLLNRMVEQRERELDQVLAVDISHNQVINTKSPMEQKTVSFDRKEEEFLSKSMSNLDFGESNFSQTNEVIGLLQKILENQAKILEKLEIS